MKLNLSTSGWEDLVDLLLQTGVILSPDHARSGFTGPGETRHGIAFIISDHPTSTLRLGAVLAEAFNQCAELTALHADGYGVADLLADAGVEPLGGREQVVYFPGHFAQAL